jgi:poly(3-hydroxybutyrate) depolymerase
MLSDHEVYITDWTDARMVPLAQGSFDLNTYIDYLIEMIQLLGPDTHVMAVCQPGPAALAAVGVMAKAQDPVTPRSLIIMGSPIDTRKSPTAPTELAEQRPLSWFENNVVMSVPWPHPGVMRRVYPGFVQLSSFMAMNSDAHTDAHRRVFFHLIEGDGDSVEKHREFYDEYLAVMDLTADFYLQTVRDVFQTHALPEKTFTHHGEVVDLSAITKTALMTIEGEKDDISGIGQTQAAHDLCTNLPEALQADYVQEGVGHYGIFNGSRWRSEIQPRVRDFIRSHNIT